MTILQEPIKAAIWHSLNHYAYSNAIFIAERLFAEVGSSDALFLLATAYYRSGKPKVTQLLLEKHGMTVPECKLLYAQCAWELEQYAKVEQVLTSEYGLRYAASKGINLMKGQPYILSVINEIHSEFGESACFALNLLGKVYLRTERADHAEHCLRASLKLNPFLWISFERMCQAGRKPNPTEIFNVENLQSFVGCRSQLPTLPSTASNQQHASPAMPRRKSLSKELESENDAPDPTTILRARQAQNRNYLSEQQQTAPVPMSVTPSSVFSMKSGFPTAISKPHSTIPSTKPVTHVHSEHLVTPPPTRVDFAGIISTSGSLKPLPSSAISNKDATIPSPGSEFFRSTPAGDHRSEWDNSIDSITCGGITSSTVRRSTRTQQRIGRGLIDGPNTLSPLTPSFGILPLADTPSPVSDRGMTMVTPADTIQHHEISAPMKKMITRQSRKPDHVSNPGPGKLHFSSENSHRLTPSNTTNTSNQSSTPSNQQTAPVRRSTRIFANAGNSIKENNRNIGKSKFNQPKPAMKKNVRSRQATTKSVRDLSEEISKADIAGSEKPNHQNMSINTNNTQAQMLASQKTAAEGLMMLLREMGRGYLALCQYKCKEAINIFNTLPTHQRKTGWVYSVLGRAHFELTDYNEAANMFRELRIAAPHRLKGLEIFSTTLWHLQKEVELSKLAHDMKELDTHCPETWCAIGNCFSLQRDHSSAASFFQRAIQLDPQSSYAYTLLGHEMGLSEDLEGALTCYRKAVRWNPRHYTAWYGIGTIYYKQEKFKMAEIHFRKALAINSQNSVLLCHIGIVQHALKQTASALRTLDTAVEMEPRNPLCKFHRANVLFAAERYEDAAKELKELKEMVPKESLVHFLLGKVYKKLKQNHMAVICFSWAMDLDPKGANNQIKEAIDKQHLPDDDDLSETEDTNEGSILETSALEHSEYDNSGMFGHGGVFQESDIRNDFQERRRIHGSNEEHLDSDSESL